MNVEHEVIEQIEEEPNGRPLPWVCELIRALGPNTPMEVLQGMWRSGLVALADRMGTDLPRWACEAVFRTGEVSSEVHVRATETGSRWVHDGSAT